MSLNRKITVALLVSLVGYSSVSVFAAEVCSRRPDHPLRFVDVFDGSVEDMAILVPDKAKARSGHWTLGYVYDANRFVTVRCKYADDKAVDVKLADRVNRCDYKINAKKTLALLCK
jgi:hypothetical protein